MGGSFVFLNVRIREKFITVSQIYIGKMLDKILMRKFSKFTTAIAERNYKRYYVILKVFVI